MYDENDYYGPFGLNRVGTYIFYIGMLVFTFLAVVFLIMTAIFYSQSQCLLLNRFLTTPDDLLQVIPTQRIALARWSVLSCAPLQCTSAS